MQNKTPLVDLIEYAIWLITYTLDDFNWIFTHPENELCNDYLKMILERALLLHDLLVDVEKYYEGKKDDFSNYR